MKVVHTNESQNFFMNIYYIATDTGYGITKLEKKAGLATGHCIMGIRRNSSPTLRTAKKLSDIVGFTIDELMLDPKEFRRIYNGDN